MQYGPPQLKGTALLRTLAQADLLLKTIATGVELSGMAPFARRSTVDGLLAKLPPHVRELLLPVFDTPGAESSVSTLPVLKLFVKVQNAAQFSEGFSVFFGAVTMCVSPDSSIGAAPNLDSKSAEHVFARRFTDNHELIGAHLPVFLRLRELLKRISCFLHGSVAVKAFKETHSELPRKLVEKIKESLRDTRRKSPTRVRENPTSAYIEALRKSLEINVSSFVIRAFVTGSERALQRVATEVASEPRRSFKSSSII